MLDKFLIGHYTNKEKATGVTVIIAPDGAVGGASIRGSAPGTRETDLLKSEATVEKINAVVLAGGSAYGLEASCGVMKHLREKRIGYSTGTQLVPIVCSAILYDLDYKAFGYPDIEAGYLAASSARSNNLDMGSIGAGTGATVGKIMGLDRATKSGIGVATAKYRDIEVMAYVAVNAFGDVYDNNNIIAGARSDDGFYNTCKVLAEGAVFDTAMKNTTIGCILTNAVLSKAEANKLADQVHNAYAIAIRPTHTKLDGDAIFVMSSSSVHTEFIQLAEIAIQTMEKAIINAVKYA